MIRTPQVIMNLPEEGELHSGLVPYVVGLDDPRTALHGELGLRARRGGEPVPLYSLLAPYGGKMLFHFE